jgi:hypothetical protein
MNIRNRTYQVVSKNAVMVEFPDGNAVTFPPGRVFAASSLNNHIVRLLRINSIREVTPREIPSFAVDLATQPKTFISPKK